ncbi:MULTISPECIES: hypothetical protein [unclassified Enterococcus]|uniref:hypothetical protein n=1 Tax=unclassified Enterococcus TaxID=2608891 RepID=UPI003D2C4479
MKRIFELALVSAAFLSTMVGFSGTVTAEEVQVFPTNQSSSIQRNWVIPDLTLTDVFDPRLSVIYNSSTQEYSIIVPTNGERNPGGWQTRYTIRERDSGRLITEGRVGNSPETIERRFRDTGVSAYTVVLYCTDDLWGITATSRVDIVMNHRVTVYEGPNGTGASLDNLGFVNRPKLLGWANRINSIRVQPRMKVTFYEETGFRNGSRTIMNSGTQERLINLLNSSWSNRISSMRVEPITGNEFGANFFENSDQTGAAIRHTTPFNNPLVQGELFNRISSIELYPNTGVEIFNRPNFSGRREYFENRTNEMLHVGVSALPINDSVTSYRVTRLN